MAARRLVIILVVLFAISIAAAALAPDRRSIVSESTETTTTTEADPPPAGPAGAGEAMARIDLSAERPETVRATVGERLTLTIGSAQPTEVEIAPLGLYGFPQPLAPAVFALLPDQPGTLPITEAVSGELLGRLVVEREAD